MKLDQRYRTLRTYISRSKKNSEKNKEKLIAFTQELNAIATLMNEKLSEEKYKLYSFETFTALEI
ncbi:MAG: hypothetical protein PF450_07175 [Bacteroidales bacterium]|jgi:hypothetical protein|nr:hypothetical protein [Bacteroidales bacterium]